MFTNKLDLRIIRRLATLCFLITVSSLGMVVGALAQSSTPQPTPEETYNGYRVAATTEFGWRWRSLDGSLEKYKSDLNYKQGFRFFDSNIFMEKENGSWFDSLLIMNSGWGADPNGYFRLNMEKVGFYKMNANTRRIKYYNNLSTHASPLGFSEHTQDWAQSISDMDVSLFPQSQKLRLNLGVSFSETTGPGFWTIRAYSDEFMIAHNTKNSAADYRLGAEGKLWGWNWGLSQGFRTFRDKGNYQLGGPSAGNTTTNTSALTTYTRFWPVTGHGSFTQFNLNRTFADRLDFTGRVMYSSTTSRSSLNEKATGRDNSNAFVDQDSFLINGDAKRPQTRVDFGLTLRATDKFRISDTITHDQFSVNGGENLNEYFLFRNATNTTSTVRTVTSSGYRVNDYKRTANTIEADYQFSKAFSFHIGYRYTKREVDVTGLDYSLTLSVVNPSPSPTPSPTPRITVIDETESNATNTVFAGMKIKPVKNWVIFWDVEHGSADNVFSRLENYKFTNFRVRNKVNFKNGSFNLGLISKDNENPSETNDPIPVPFGTKIKSRNYTSDLDWGPNDRIRFAAGYTYRNMTAKTPVYIYIPTRTLGSSEYYVKEHYGYAEVSAKLHKRLSVFATYRLNKDKGQGDIPTPAITTANIVSSYPMSFSSPEIKAAIRLTRNVDWNVGYQYYNYDDVQTPAQNYKAHLPFTSLRIYFGGRAADR